MARPSRTGGKTGAGKRRKASSVKGRNSAKTKQRVAPTAIQSKRATVSGLGRDLKEAREQQAATAEILKVIASSPSDVQPVLEAIAASAAKLFEPWAATIVTLKDEVLHWNATAALHPEFDVERAKALYPLPFKPDVFPSARAIAERRIVEIPDSEAADTPDIARESGRISGFRSVTLVPLIDGARGIGTINLTHPQAGLRLSEKQLALVQTFANQAVIAIQNTRLFNETKEALERQTATSEVLKVIARSPSELRPVFDAIAARSVQLVGGHSAAVSMFVGDRVDLGAFTPVNPEADAALIALYPRRLADYPLFDLVRGGEVAQVTDIHTEPRVPSAAKATARTRGFRGVLLVPMNSENGPVGVITVTRREPGTFAPQHIQLMQTFADQAVIAIENTRLFNETREALARQTATSDVLKVIASSPSNLQPVFDAIAERSKELVGGHSTTVFRFVGDMVELAAVTSVNAEADAAIQSAFPQPITTTPTLIKVSRGDVVEAADIESDATIESNEKILTRARGVRSRLMVPLRNDTGTIGAISVTRTEPGTFAQQHVELLQTFADQAVIAIKNVELFEEVQARTRDLEESLQRQTATSEVLQIISSSPGDLVPVFDKMLENATRICGAEFGSMLLAEGGGFRQAALYNPPAALAAARTGKVLQHHPLSAPATAMRSRQVVQIEDVRTSKAYLARSPATIEIAELGGARTIVVVPMLGDGVAIGSITVYRQEVRPFSDKQIELLTNFARQAVIAIENARLLRELRVRTDDLSEALVYQTGSSNILKVIASSPTDVGPALRAIVDSACEICDADDAVVLLKEGDDLVCSAHYGPIPFGFKKRPINRNWVTGRAVVEKAPQHIHDLLGSEGADFPEAREMARHQVHRTVLSVPLLRDGEAIGAIMLRRIDVHPFDDKQIELLKSFADQAVIAISNVRLFEQVQERTRELSQSLDDLRAAQDRLVQTEKLASLGQLAAGIAHEIKNPLNFVNNFSALSAELIGELDETLAPAPLDRKMRDDVGELTQMLKSNLEKVVQHGKRADSIVKNMLQHSRAGTGERRSAAVNALVEESLNLAYHGARAEKPGFSVILKHDLDPEAGEIDIYPQEITRALLNLISNGFYAATHRKSAGDTSFEPVLTATTRNLGESVEIRIHDNGTGIPPEVKEKMFDPFFTTKPTGEGTGLGLSMTHDIIVKQHGGRIDVETEPGMFTEFIITLPRNEHASQTGSRHDR